MQNIGREEKWIIDVKQWFKEGGYEVKREENHEQETLQKALLCSKRIL